MKKLTLLVIITTLATLNSYAQISAGGGFSYGSGAKKMGINLRGLYTLNENIDLTGGLTFFFPDKTLTSAPFIGTIETKTSYWTFDIDGHYNFPVSSQLTFYPLGGINITGVSVKINSTKKSETKIGLNIGAGGSFELTDQLTGFGEMKYTISNADQLVITLGILYSFN